MARRRLVISPDAAAVIRTLHPDLKRSVRAALEAISEDPTLGLPLRGELLGFWRYRVRRFRIVYSAVRSDGAVRVLGVGPRRSIYEDLVRSRHGRPKK